MDADRDIVNDITLSSSIFPLLKTLDDEIDSNISQPQKQDDLCWWNIDCVVHKGDT